MKNFRLFAAALAAFVLFGISSEAQPNNWMDKMKSEKIAFITAQLDLTPEEAQVFWPVYNQISKEKMESQKAMMKAYHELMKALNEDNVSDKEIDRLLDAYLIAKQANKAFAKGDADKYRKVLPSKKVAKLYVAEERFRRHHIQSMRHHPGQEHGRQTPEARK